MFNRIILNIFSWHLLQIGTADVLLPDSVEVPDFKKGCGKLGLQPTAGRIGLVPYYIRLSSVKSTYGAGWAGTIGGKRNTIYHPARIIAAGGWYRIRRASTLIIMPALSTLDTSANSCRSSSVTLRFAVISSKENQDLRLFSSFLT